GTLLKVFLSMRQPLAALLLSAFVSAYAGTHFHPGANEVTVPSELIVRLNPGADVRSVISSGNATAQTAGGSSSSPVISLLKSLRHGNVHVVKVPPAVREIIGDLLAKLPGVQYVEANQILSTTLANPNDPGA